MKKILLTTIIALIVFQVTAQEIAHCTPPSSAVVFDIQTKIKSFLGNGGEILYNENSMPSYYVVNDGSINATIFNSTLWLGGIDESSGDLKLAAMTYRQLGHDFWSGPIDDGSQTTDSLQCDNYNKHWFIDQATIDKFKNDEELSELEDMLLKEWPGKGNPHLNSNHLNQVMAPFVDVDGDEMYNPDNGDYPSIKGDRAVWWIINDVGNEHTESGGEAFGFEIQKLFYGFDDDPELQYTSFFDVSITNKSTNNYEDFIFGHRVDVDLGQYNDDYVGCDTLNAFGFVYNGDALDDGFGDNAPLQSCQFINVPDGYYNNQNDLYSFIYYSNNFNNFGNPVTTQHFYNYLTGKWKDGSPMTIGGNGTGQDLEPTRYLYTGNPSNTESWSECNAGTDPSDRTFLMTSGQYKFTAGETKTWTMAMHTIPNVGGTCPDIQPLIDKAQYTKNFYENFVLVNVEDVSIGTSFVFPNPTTSKLFFNMPHLISSIEVFALDGHRILQKNISHNYINVEGFSKGLYYMRLFGNDGKIYRTKFLKK